MEKELLGNLSPEMQARLDKWRTNTLPVKNEHIPRGISPGNFVARKRDYGDDMSEFEPKSGDIA